MNPVPSSDRGAKSARRRSTAIPWPGKSFMAATQLLPDLGYDHSQLELELLGEWVQQHHHEFAHWEACRAAEAWLLFRSVGAARAAPRRGRSERFLSYLESVLAQLTAGVDVPEVCFNATVAWRVFSKRQAHQHRPERVDLGLDVLAKFPEQRAWSPYLAADAYVRYLACSHRETDSPPERSNDFLVFVRSRITGGTTLFPQWVRPTLQ